MQAVYNRHMLSDVDIEKFREAYRQHYGKDIEKREAAEMAAKLYSLMKFIYKPMTHKEYESIIEQIKNIRP